jgi:hypothetical protein
MNVFDANQNSTAGFPAGCRVSWMLSPKSIVTLTPNPAVDLCISVECVISFHKLRCGKARRVNQDGAMGFRPDIYGRNRGDGRARARARIGCGRSGNYLHKASGAAASRGMLGNDTRTALAANRLQHATERFHWPKRK